MYLYFNKNGTLTTQINHGEVPRQGANLDVFALVDLDFFDENLDPNPEHWVANIKATDSRGESVITTTLMTGLNTSGNPESMVFAKANNAEATFNLVNGQTYYAFEYLINVSMFPAVTALSGNIKIGINFVNSEDSNLDVTCGEATVYIEPVLNSSYLKNTINPSQYRQLIYRIEHLNPVVTNAVTLDTAQTITGKKTFTNQDGIGLSELQTQPSSSSGLAAYFYDNHLYWKGQKVALNSDMPTKTSDLTNDSGYATEQYVTQSCEELERSIYEDIPTATSDLTNDSGYQTQTQVQNAINNALTSVYKFQGSMSVSDLNDYISTYPGDKSNLNGWVFNITDSGNLTNSSGTTPVVAGDNVAFYVYNIPSQLYEWDKLAATVDTSSFVTTSQVESKIAEGVPYLTTAPSSANTSGKLKFVVLSSEPATYYDGYYYIITGSNS